MTEKGIKKITYLVQSHTPWLPGKIVICDKPIPAWHSTNASNVNMLIMKIIGYEPR